MTSANTPDAYLHYMVSNANGFVDRTLNANFPAKPFNTGETNYSTDMVGFHTEIEKIFHNYDVSFHNEIWAGAFSGRFATGSSWKWERVFWWPDGLPVPPDDDENNFDSDGEFSNLEGDTNYLDLGFNVGIPLVNRPLYHHFQALAELFARPSWQAYEFFNGNYSPHKIFNTNSDLESYYLKNATNDVAIGWVHNRNAWVMNNYYLASGAGNQNFLGCDLPNTNIISLTGFDPNTSFYITWVTTHVNSTILPPDTQVTSTESGTLNLDLTGWFGATENNYLDTLRSDYAFIISPDGFVKRLPSADAMPSAGLEGWDFIMYPNPAHEAVFIQLRDDNPKEITLCDLTGRRIKHWSSVTGTLHTLSIDDLAKGIYVVIVADGIDAKTKKLIIQ